MYNWYKATYNLPDDGPEETWYFGYKKEWDRIPDDLINCLTSEGYTNIRDVCEYDRSKYKGFFRTVVIGNQAWFI